jgi:hypothetical protein
LGETGDPRYVRENPGFGRPRDRQLVLSGAAPAPMMVLKQAIKKPAVGLYGGEFALIGAPFT